MAEESDWQATVAALKKAADEKFSAGDYEGAIAEYSQAISIDNQNHVLYSNRSASYLKLNEKSKALQDASRCVSLAPDWEKGYSRLGSAQFALGRHDAALATYKLGLVLNPANAALAEGARAAQEGKERAEEERKKKEMEEREAKMRAEEEEKAAAAAAAAAAPTSSSSAAAPAAAPTEDDLLGDFFGDLAAATEASSSTCSSVPKEVLPQAKYTSQAMGTSSDQIGRILSPNYAWKNLNPFLVLQLDLDSNAEDLKARYKKLSSLVHPDKNIGNVEEAAKAFDEVKRAYESLKVDGNRKLVEDLVKAGRERAAREFKGDKKKAVDEFVDFENKEVMKVFAEVENNRREVERRMLNQKKRERSQEDEEQEKRKKEYKFEKEWRDEDRMGNRMAGWQDFNKKGGATKDEEAEDD